MVIGYRLILILNPEDGGKPDMCLLVGIATEISTPLDRRNSKKRWRWKRREEKIRDERRRN